MAEALIKRLRGKVQTPFVGRADELATLDSHLAHHEPAKLKISMIHGPPGAGKTQLALAYAIRYIDEHPGSKPILIEADTMTQFSAGLRRFVRFCRKGKGATDVTMCRWEKEDRDLNRTTRMKLTQASSDWILLIDGITMDTLEAVHDLIPKTAPYSGRIILTTRSPYIQRLLTRAEDHRCMQSVYLKGLKLADGRKLLSELVKYPNSLLRRDNGLPYLQRDVLKGLEGMPLLVRQYATFINAPPLRACLPDCTTNAIDKICEHVSTSIVSPLSQSFYSPWNAIVRQLRSAREVAADLLCMLCFLHPRNIEIGLFAQSFTWPHAPGRARLANICESDFLRDGKRFDHLHALLSDQQELKVVLQTLAKLGIFDYPDTSDTSLIRSFTSPMIQFAVRMTLMPDVESRFSWLNLTLRAFEGGICIFPAPPPDLNWKRLSRHLDSLWNHCAELGTITPFLCAVRGMWTTRLEQDGKYQEAVEWQQRTVEVLRSAHDVEYMGLDPSIIRQQELQLGLLYAKVAPWLPQGDLLMEDAERHLTQCFNPDPTTPEKTVEVVSALITVWHAQKNVSKLKRLLNPLQQVINSSETEAATNNSSPLHTLRLTDLFARALLSIAQLDCQWSLLESAHQMAITSLKAKTNLLGPDDEEVIRSTEIVAEILWACFSCPSKVAPSDYGFDVAVEAVMMMDKVWRWSVKEEGEGHPETAKVLMVSTGWKAEFEAALLKAEVGSAYRMRKRRKIKVEPT